MNRLKVFNSRQLYLMHKLHKSEKPNITRTRYINGRIHLYRMRADCKILQACTKKIRLQVTEKAYISTGNKVELLRLSGI